MISFVCQQVPVRVVFRPGAAGDLISEAVRLEARRLLVVTSAGARRRLEPIIAALGETCVGIFDGAQTHCPQEVADAARARAREVAADAVIAIGGGSTLGLGKILAVKDGLPWIAVPTTYCGSEMTRIYGMKMGTEKRTWADDAAFARTAVYDPELTLSLPAPVTATSGMNGLAHAVEALYAQNRNPLAMLLAEESARSFARALPACVGDGHDRDARSLALYAAWLGGMVVSLSGIALHHRLCHVLGGHFGVPHGASNSIVLPHVVAYNAPAAGPAIAALSRALNCAEPAGALYDLARTLGAPASLRELGVDRAGLDAVAAETVATLKYNPRPVDAASLRRLLDDAYEGRRPA